MIGVNNCRALLALCCLASSLALGANESVQKSRAPASSATLATTKTPDAVEEVKLKALKDEVQTFKDFTQNILSTVYFALGTVVVIVVAMLGFSWYQNFKVYERDKEAMRQALANMISEQLSARTTAIENELKQRFVHFDGRIAEALEKTIKRINDASLSFETSVFRSTHFDKTPETDFFQFCATIQGSIGRVSVGVLKDALSLVVEHLEQLPKVESPTQTALLELANRVPPECSVYAERIKVLSSKRA